MDHVVLIQRAVIDSVENNRRGNEVEASNISAVLYSFLCSCCSDKIQVGITIEKLQFSWREDWRPLEYSVLCYASLRLPSVTSDTLKTRRCYPCDDNSDCCRCSIISFESLFDGWIYTAIILGEWIWGKPKLIELAAKAASNHPPTDMAAVLCAPSIRILKRSHPW
jgi:hypothetical protein